MRRGDDNRGLAVEKPAHKAPDQEGPLTARLHDYRVEFGLGWHMIHRLVFRIVA